MLIEQYGSLPALLAESRAYGHVAVNAPGVSQALEAFAAAMAHVLRFPVVIAPVLSNWSALLDYLRADMAHGNVERFRVLHLNARNMLIRDEVMWAGSLDETHIHVREVIRRAMDLGSASLILVHNHPSGDPQPSRADIQVTQTIAEAGRTMGIAVHDHLIIGTQGHVSLRSKGWI